MFGDDDLHSYTFNDILCLTSVFASSVSIKIGSKFIQISRQKSLKLPEKRRTTSSQESGSQTHPGDGVQRAQPTLYTLNDAIPRAGCIFNKTGSNELRLETKTWLSKNIKLKCDAGQVKLLVDAEAATQVAPEDSELRTKDVLDSGLSAEEYLSKILVVALMGLSDSDDSIRTESQCLLSRIFRRLGSGPAFEHTMVSCPPSNMNRLISEISTRMVTSNPRLALHYLEFSLFVVKQLNASSSHKPPVNLQ